MKRILASAAFGGLLVMAAVRLVGWEQALAALVQVKWPFLALALLGQIAVLLMKAARWHVALCAVTATPVRGVVTASLLGFAANLLVPARLGELIRAHAVARSSAIPRSLALTSNGLTQFFDLLLLGLLLLAVSGTVALRAFVSEAVIAIGMLVGCGLLLAMIFLARTPWRARLTRACPVRWRKAVEFYLGQFRTGLRVLANRTAVVRAVCLTLVVWSLEAVSVRLGLEAFGVSATWLAALTLLVVLNLAFCLPLTPANVGPHQFLCVGVLALFGVAAERALAFSLGYQAATSVLILLLGAGALVRTGVRAGVLYRDATIRDDTVPPPAVEVVGHGRCTLSRFEGAVPSARRRDPACAPQRVRELHVHAGADREGF